MKAEGDGQTPDTPHIPYMIAGGGPAALDAWARLKTITDHSLLHGMFTNGVPTAFWMEQSDDVEQTARTNLTGAGGLLVLTSGVTLNHRAGARTYRSGRYEPNRGQLYAASILLPNPTAAGKRRFGIFTAENGLFFERRADGLYACRRTTPNGGPTENYSEKITLPSTFPSGFDYSKGQIYDIQAQLRGVGNIKFLIGNPNSGVMEVVHTMDLLGTLDGMSVANPTLPLAFECENLGDEVVLKCGCCDLSSEGGVDQNHQYGSIPVYSTTGELPIPTGTNIPILVVRNKLLTPSGAINTRDIQAFVLGAYADANAYVRVWVTRDETAITLNDQSWADYGDGFLEYIHYDYPNVTTPMTFDTAKAEVTFGDRVTADISYTSSAMFNDKAEIHQSPGDIFIFTLHHAKGNQAFNGGITYEFGEEL